MTGSMHSRVTLVALLSIATVLFSACTPQPDVAAEREKAAALAHDAVPINPQETTTGTELALLDLQLVPVAEGLTRPTYVTEVPDGTRRLFVLEKATAKILVVERDGTSSTLRQQPFLDLSAIVGAEEKEQGLLGLAFHPDYKNNGRFFVHYTAKDWSVNITEYRVSKSNPNTAEPKEVKHLIHQPKKVKVNGDPATHHGGQLEFGPSDGYLYIAIGDGACCDDPLRQAQNLNAIQGKILRIDVNKGNPYGIPPDNPFVGGPGRDEIYAYGLRNPWRFSFDREKNNRLIAADAGRLAYEEVDIIQKGKNYGWPSLEGPKCYVKPGDPTITTCSKSSKTPPIYAYDHFHDDCCIIGGYTYRGKSAPSLYGKYIFGDFCSGNIYALEEQNGQWRCQLVSLAPFMISSFGEDLDRELYVCEYQDVDAPVSSIYRVVEK